jgi:predicted MPP superfamily phosphohydrolase
MLRFADFLPNFLPSLLLIVFILLAYSLWRSPSGTQRLPRLAALIALSFGLIDWLMLVCLPRLHLSYGAVNPAWFLMLILRMIVLLTITVGLICLFLLHPATRTHRTVLGAFILWGFVNLTVSAVAFDAMYIEPFHLQVTHLSLPGPTFLPGRPLRILHITDTHIERITQRERDVFSQAKAIQPDLIVLTGDYLNLDYLDDPVAIRETHEFISGLNAPYGIYAVSGSVESPSEMQSLFDGLPVTVLDDATVRVPLDDSELYILGVTSRQDGSEAGRLHALKSLIPPEAYTVLLFHTPDLIETAAQEGIDLYFAGHTHGGQIQLPFLGPIINLSVYGRQYAEGLHTLGPTTLYVSHGLGMEGFGLPRARFLCPPEIVVIDIK